MHPQPARGGDGVAERGKVADADEHLAVDLEAEQHAEQRDAVHEAACAVDRIDEPAVRRGAAIVAELLADDRVRREAGGNGLADQALGASIRDSDRRPIGFQLDVERGLIVRAHEAPGLLRQIDGELEEGAGAQLLDLAPRRPASSHAGSVLHRQGERVALDDVEADLVGGDFGRNGFAGWQLALDVHQHETALRRVDHGASGVSQDSGDARLRLIRVGELAGDAQVAVGVVTEVPGRPCAVWPCRLASNDLQRPPAPM